MKAMILAAGRGERMRPLTNSTPKPLLEIHGQALIVHQLLALKHAGIKDFVINTAAMGDQIHDRLGNGSGLGISITYSDEGDTPLETAGGIIKALPLLGNSPFIVTNADIYTDFDYSTLPACPEKNAHLVLVPNPPHHPKGDFALEGDRLLAEGDSMWTFSGIGLYQPRFFANCRPGHQALAPMLFDAIEKQTITAQVYPGYWNDIGTPERLEQANKTNI